MSAARAQPVVTRCVCRDVPFARIATLRQEEGLDFNAIRDRTGCCTGCTMCEPYVRLTIATGQTEFSILEPDAARDALALDV